MNCKNKNICEHFKIGGYPTIQVYLKGQILQNETPRQLEPLLEYLDKLLSPDFIQISEKQISEFSNIYGEVSFLFVNNEEDSEFISCIREIAIINKPYIYFGHLKKSIYNDTSGKTFSSPAIIVIIKLI